MSGKSQLVKDTAYWLKEEEARLLDPLLVTSEGEDVRSGWWPDFDEMDKALKAAIYFDPPAAEECSLLFKIVDLPSYGSKGKPLEGSVMEVATERRTSRYGHHYAKRRDGFELLPPTTIIAEDKPEHDYTGWAIDGFGVDGCGYQFKTNSERAKGSILLHTALAFVPGLELTRAWSKMFDAERNKRDNGYHEYTHYHRYGKPELRSLEVDPTSGIIRSYKHGPFGDPIKTKDIVKHQVDHPYGNTATLQPGFRATLQLRTVLEDVNHSNLHPDHAIGDFLQYGDFTGFQPTETFLDWDDFIKAGWVHMMNQAMALRPYGGFQFDKPDYWCLALS